ncbi:MAG: transcription antitermination factor NusB, partial [Acidimicrobiales bacterium]
PGLLSQATMEARDRHLVTELVYGTCRMQRACDWLAARHTRGPLDAEVRAAVRLGAYQLVWTRVPTHAAVSATVGEVRGPGRSVVNAVLRRVADRVARGPVTWPDPATELSYPDWIVDRLAADLGSGPARQALIAMNEPAAMTVRPDGYVQDAASQMVAAHVGARPGDLVLDVCSAPGGKATAIAGAGPGLVVAGDSSLARARVVRANARRLDTAAVAAVAADGTAGPWRPATFDRVLVDAPCSGLGVLRRRPDARWRARPADVGRLAALQRRLLDAAVPLLAPGGVLVFSVCTLTADETRGIDNWMARSWPELAPVPPPRTPWRPAGRGGLLLPQAAGTDGMFVLSLRAPAVPR